MHVFHSFATVYSCPSSNPIAIRTVYKPVLSSSFIGVIVCNNTVCGQRQVVEMCGSGISGHKAGHTVRV